jgi:4-hydroxy-2-oxoheptanedioate aldolase
MSNQIASPIIDGKTRLQQSLERARDGHGPSLGQWLALPGYTLARTIAPLGQDVGDLPAALFSLALRLMLLP